VFDRLQSSLMLASKHRAYPRGPLFCFSRLGWAPGLDCIHMTGLERLASDKHSSLLGRFVKYSLKKFHNIYTKGLRNKTFYGRNLQIGQVQFFQPSVLFEGKVRSLPLRVTPEPEGTNTLAYLSN
jgi:hypothetical protein